MTLRDHIAPPDSKIIISGMKNQIFFAVLFGMISAVLTMASYGVSLGFSYPHGALFYFLCGSALTTLVLTLLVTFRSSFAIVFDGDDKTVEERYLWQRLAPDGRVTRFSDWAAIQSYVSKGDEYGGPTVNLVLHAADGKRLRLKCEPAPNPIRGWWKITPTYREPDEILVLRSRIAKLTGIEDLGFSNEQV